MTGRIILYKYFKYLDGFLQVFFRFRIFTDLLTQVSIVIIEQRQVIIPEGKVMADAIFLYVYCPFQASFRLSQSVAV